MEAIYHGACVSESASEEMLNLLMQQQITSKIPAGLPENVIAANKTGETEDTQHDAAIVFGGEKDYILCVMSSDITDADEAITIIQNISWKVYQYLMKEN